MRQHHMQYTKPVCIADKFTCACKSTKLQVLLQEGAILHSQGSSAQEKNPFSPCPCKDLPTPALPEESSREKAPDPPQCTVALAHADTAEDSLLVGLVLSQVFTHYVSTQAEAHNNQLGLRVGLLDGIHHGTKFPGAS